MLGSQIAFQTAFHGFRVKVYDIKQDFPDKAKERLRTLGERYIEDVHATEKQIDEAMGKIIY